MDTAHFKYAVSILFFLKNLQTLSEKIVLENLFRVNEYHSYMRI